MGPRSFFMIAMCLLVEVAEAKELPSRARDRMADRTKAVSAATSIDGRSKLELTYVESKRDPKVRSTGEVTFSFTEPPRFAIGSYNTYLELDEGFGGRWLLTKEPRFPIKHEKWKVGKYGERKWFVTLRVYGANPRCTELEMLKVKLHFKQLGPGRPFRTAEFKFDRIPF